MRDANEQYYLSVQNQNNLWIEETLEKKSIHGIEKNSFSPPPRMGTVTEDRGQKVNIHISETLVVPDDISDETPRSS
jgi:hypothetical protein